AVEVGQQFVSMRRDVFAWRDAHCASCPSRKRSSPRWACAPRPGATTLRCSPIGASCSSRKRSSPRWACAPAPCETSSRRDDPAVLAYRCTLADDEMTQTVGVEQVDRADRLVAAHVVERRPDALDVAPGKGGPGEPVRGELHSSGL